MRRKSHTAEPSNIGISNSLHSKDLLDGDATTQQSVKSTIASDDMNNSSQQSTRKTSFATLPNTTTWQQQSVNYQKIDHPSES